MAKASKPFLSEDDLGMNAFGRGIGPTLFDTPSRGRATDILRTSILSE